MQRKKMSHKKQNHGSTWTPALIHLTVNENNLPAPQRDFIKEFIKGRVKYPALFDQCLWVLCISIAKIKIPQPSDSINIK